MKPKKGTEYYTNKNDSERYIQLNKTTYDLYKQNIDDFGNDYFRFWKPVFNSNLLEDKADTLVGPFYITKE